jgi:hypothetical protein
MYSLHYYKIHIKLQEIKKLAQEEIRKLFKKVIIITSQLMGLLQSPAHTFVQTRVHYVSCLLIRMTLQMMKRLDDYFYSDKNAKSDYDDDNDGDDDNDDCD